MNLLDVHSNPKMIVFLILMYAFYFSYRINVLSNEFKEIKQFICNEDGLFL